MKKAKLTELLVLGVSAVLLPASVVKAVEIGPTGTITDVTPELRFIDNTTGGGDPGFEIEVQGNCLADEVCFDADGQSTPFATWNLLAPEDSFVLDGGGRIGVRLGSSGLGVTTPSADLHVGGGQVLLDNISSTWALNPGSSGLWFHQSNTGPVGVVKFNNNNTQPDRLAINGNKVGIGTEFPDELFHVRGSDATSGGGNSVAGKVENTSGTTAIRTMFELVNNGDPRFRYVNTANGQAWALNPTNGEFRISLDGSGVTEVRVSPGGDVRIAGNLTEGSDRASKENFEFLDETGVLSKVAALPVTEWSYKHNPEQRHIGPMAQDFHEAFGLGADETTISARNLASVSLVAIKAQQSIIEEQSLAIENLSNQLKLLQKQIAQ